MTQEITEHEIKELRLMKRIADLEKEEKQAFDILYDMYTKTPEYIQYDKIRNERCALQSELKKLREKRD